MFQGIKKLFNTSAAAAPLPAAEQVLKDLKIRYRRRADGSLFVPGSVDLSGKGLAELPDMSTVTVGGNFYGFGNRLTSLKGAPKSVAGCFSVGDNRLETLEGAPEMVGAGFYCEANRLASLEFAPASVGGDFLCGSNRLTSLQYAPEQVGGDFSCANNQLATLEFAPKTVRGQFSCWRNELTSLEHAPQAFKKLFSDLGTFKSWEAVPASLRTAPRATVAPVKIPKSLSL